MEKRCGSCLHLGEPAPCDECAGGKGWPCLVAKDGQHVHPWMSGCVSWEALPAEQLEHVCGGTFKYQLYVDNPTAEGPSYRCDKCHSDALIFPKRG